MLEICRSSSHEDVAYIAFADGEAGCPICRTIQLLSSALEGLRDEVADLRRGARWPGEVSS